MDITITNTRVQRIKSAIVVAKQLQHDALDRIRAHEGLPDLIAHRIHHGLDIPLELNQAHADLQEAEEDLDRARQGETNLRGQLRTKGMVA